MYAPDAKRSHSSLFAKVKSFESFRQSGSNNINLKEEDERRAPRS
jgi:hypothetical protein